ncbi:ATP-dependent DNA helicase PIF1 [Ceratobasidium sp. AG-Ba]|nr:ATP-dependent DNA helicase PIF1 [Ceratobasidium sp. AG-Ba]
MTANPNWPEIQNSLLPGQTASDRPDICVRVFELKRRELMKDITQKKVFGVCTAHVHTIEFQKRGLPHMHLLVWLERASHIIEPSDVDEIISAELPDPVAEPQLYQTVSTSMMHGPCGPNHPDSRCWDEARQICTKGYWPPKPWANETTMVNDSYPQYRRRNHGRVVVKRINGRDVPLDNRNVVPYSPYLCRKFNCHINVETCSGIGAVKYIFKYVYKGGDRITAELQRIAAGQAGPNAPELENLDEIAVYLEGRWISPYEALWRIFRFRLHKEFPNIVRLQIHLENHQTVTFRDGALIQELVENPRDTTLTAYFKLNADPNPTRRANANALLYQEVPSRFSWDKNGRKFNLRRSKTSNDGTVTFVGGALGRMYAVPVNSGDKFYLRTLLTAVRGATSYEHLRTVNGILYPTFREACIALGIVGNDNEWVLCLQEAATAKTGSQLRQLFVVILMSCAPTNPAALWEQFRPQICDDLRHRLSQPPWNRNDIPDGDIYDYGLYLIEQLVLESGSTMRDVNLPTCTQNWDLADWEQNKLIREQYQLRDKQPDGAAEEAQAQLNAEQRTAFDQVLASVENNLGTTFFLDGPAGTGKTFLYKTLCYTLRGQGKIVLCVASSGLAALLLPGGKTAHSLFKIPLDIHEDSTCNISKNSQLSQLLLQTDLIIWDEVPMQHRYCAEAFDRTCRDVGHHSDRPFGGITVVFGGDFRQTLPVIPKGQPEQIIAACLKRSPLWPRMQKLRLSTNMRLQGDPEMAAFAAWLLHLGEGRDIQEGVSSIINFQPSMLVQSRSNLIDKVYAGLANIEPQSAAADDYLRSRTILTSRNDDVLILNKKILQVFPGQSQTFLSADSVDLEHGVDNPQNGALTTEYLNSLNSASIPVSKLELKPGCPVMVLRNLARAEGVCNGTRGIVMSMQPHVLELRLLTGPCAGKNVFIPRIPFTPQESEFGFQLRRRQFPSRNKPTTTAHDETSTSNTPSNDNPTAHSPPNTQNGAVADPPPNNVASPERETEPDQDGHDSTVDPMELDDSIDDDRANEVELDSGCERDEGGENDGPHASSAGK